VVGDEWMQEDWGDGEDWQIQATAKDTGKGSDREAKPKERASWGASAYNEGAGNVESGGIPKVSALM